MSNFISGNILYASDLNNEFAKKQDELVSGTNIKTVNGNSILGSGDLNIPNPVTVDTALSLNSTNPVQNKVIANALNNKQDIIGTMDVSNNTFISNFPNFADINFLSSVHGEDLSLLSDIKSIRLVAPVGDIITETSKYTMSYDNTKEAIVWTFK